MKDDNEQFREMIAAFMPFSIMMADMFETMPEAPKQEKKSEHKFKVIQGGKP